MSSQTLAFDPIPSSISVPPDATGADRRPLPDARAAGRAAIDLDALQTGRTATVDAVDAAAHAPDAARWLAEIGFVPGERVTVLTRAWPGRDPLMVRVGHSAFALRRWEARCIRVVPDGADDAGTGTHR
ncbi:MAG: ferrous iron transport protein A [Lautropia sp.]